MSRSCGQEVPWKYPGPWPSKVPRRELDGWRSARRGSLIFKTVLLGDVGKGNEQVEASEGRGLREGNTGGGGLNHALVSFSAQVYSCQ